MAQSYLEVGSLGLNLAHENVLGVDQVVLVQQRVFEGSAVHPDGSLRFHQQTTSIVHIDLIIIIQIVIRNPT